MCRQNGENQVLPVGQCSKNGPSRRIQDTIAGDSVELDLTHICGLLDGKDYMCFVNRMDSSLQGMQKSSKVKAAAAQSITWTTPMGLSPGHIRLFGACIGEQKLVELWGQLDEEVPILQWKDYAVAKLERDILRQVTTLDDVTYDDAVEAVIDSESICDSKRRALQCRVWRDNTADDQPSHNMSDGIRGGTSGGDLDVLALDLDDSSEVLEEDLGDITV